MKLHKFIFDEIMNCMPSTPPEAGGIIGGKDGVVTLWKYDSGYPAHGCMYRPNVEFLNSVISEWITQGFDFMGVFHVHFGSAGSLSDGDKLYIRKIMDSMPDNVSQLYFPIIVQPDRKMISFKAYVNSIGEVEIVDDYIELQRNKSLTVK